MEIPPTVCEHMFLSPAIAPFEGKPTVFGQVVHVLSQMGTKSPLPVESFGRLAVTCKELYFGLSRRVFWLNFLQLSVLASQVPQGFSVLKLFAELYGRRNNPNWKRALLTSAVSDESAAPDKLVRVHLSASNLDSQAFWRSELEALLGLAAFPTGPQAAQLKETVAILLRRGARPGELLGWAAAPGRRPNPVLAAVLAAHALAAPGLREGARAEEVAGLLGTARAVLDVAGLLHGVPLDELRKERWQLRAAGARRPPRAWAAAAALALSRMSWLQLGDVFRLPGLAKQVFREMHLQAYLEKAVSQAERADPARAGRWTPEHLGGLRQALVAVSCLRGARYPESEEAFAKSRWVERLKRPLAQLDESNPLVQVDDVWLRGGDAWQPELARKRLKPPRARTFDAVLSQDGNSAETWDRLLESRGTTVAHVYQHWRSLILLAYPEEKLEAFFRRRRDQLNLFKLLGVRQMLLSSFDEPIMTAIKAHWEESPPNEDEPRNKGGELNRVFIGLKTFRDAKGKSTSQPVVRTVHRDCNMDTLNRHLALVDKLMGETMRSDTPPEGSALVHFTAELLNPLRKGQPPSVPSYSRCSLWRNEGVCLSELCDKPLRKLRAGITWCEPKDGSVSRVDLDLSVSLLDAEWKEIATCSYHNLALENKCVVHSGDVRSAPYPQGGREAIEIDLDKLDKAYPTCQYIILTVFSFCGQPYESLADASVFLADPTTPGDGPGGQNIISAARLTGKGTQNIAAFLYFDYYNRTHLFNADATIDVNNRSTTSGLSIAASICQLIFDDHISSAPKTLRGIDVALLTAAIRTNRIVLVAAEEEGDKTANTQKVVVVERGDLDAYAFFRKAQEATLMAVPTHSHRLPAAEMLPADLAEAPVLLVAGDMPEFNGLVQSLPGAVLKTPARKLTVLNVGVDITRDQEKEVPTVDGTVRYVCGPGALDLLTGLKDD